MNWEVIGSISEAAAALAVIVTLFYLAIQIRQSNNQGRRNEIGTSLHQFSAWRMAIAQNEGLADLFVRGMDSYQSLTPIEKLRFDNLMSDRFWIWHSIWDGVQSDAFESYFWIGISEQVSQMFEHAGISDWWETNRTQFPSLYAEEIDRIRAIPPER